MTAKIIIYQCKACPYFFNYYCRATAVRDEGFKVVPQIVREEGGIPDWCPFLEKVGNYQVQYNCE